MSPEVAPARRHDVVIRGDGVLDGSGTLPVEPDVAIDGDRISAIYPSIDRPGRLEIDARGLAVAPGFINMLSWAAVQLLVDGRRKATFDRGRDARGVRRGRLARPAHG